MQKEMQVWGRQGVMSSFPASGLHLLDVKFYPLISPRARTLQTFSIKGQVII